MDIHPANSNLGETEDRVVDGEPKTFYKEKNVLVQAEKYGYTIISCSWFRRIDSNRTATSYLGTINQSNIIEKLKVASHNKFQWAKMLELHRLSSRCVSKAAALQIMFNNNKNYTQNTRWSSLVNYQIRDVLADESYMAHLYKKLRRMKLNKSRGNALAGPSRTRGGTRANIDRTPQSTRRGKALKRTSTSKTSKTSTNKKTKNTSTRSRSLNTGWSRRSRVDPGPGGIDPFPLPRRRSQTASGKSASAGSTGRKGSSVDRSLLRRTKSAGSSAGGKRSRVSAEYPFPPRPKSASARSRAMMRTLRVVEATNSGRSNPNNRGSSTNSNSSLSA